MFSEYEPVFCAMNAYLAAFEKNGFDKSGAKKGRARTPLSKPLHYISSDGFDIYVGKNNYQNDQLTFHFAEPGDIWLHANDIPGSHVILRRGEREREPSDADLTEACAVAAQNSVAKGPADVDYTEARYVSKPRGAKPGHVIYRNYRTAHVDPDPAAVAAMKKN